jgi:WD40 repeat protein
MASADLTSFLASYTSQSMTGAAQWDTSADQSKTKAPVAASGAATAVATAVVNNPLPGVAGVGLTGPSSVVKFGSMAAPKDAQCTPITRMASEFEKATSGRLIAVNDNYISYSIKGNLIRVIHFVQVTRTKLAAHPAQVVDIEFAGRDRDLLASLDVAGTLRIRRIFESDEGCQYTTEIEARLPLSGAATRVCWGPAGSNTVAVACDNTVVIMNYQKAQLVAKPTGASQVPLFTPGAVADCGSCASGHDGAVKDVQFSPDFGHLLTASEDGSVRVWQTKAGDPNTYAKPHTSMSCVMSMVAHGGAPVDTAAFVGVPFIGTSDTWSVVTGSSNNSVLRLWRTGSVSSSSSTPWSMAHEVMLESDDNAWTNVAVDDSSKFILLANAKQNACHVLHLADDASSFDLLTQWNIAHPILSFVPDTASASGDNAPAQEDYEIRCFCIQTKAISKYTFQPSECVPVVTAAPAAPVDAPKR